MLLPAEPKPRCDSANCPFRQAYRPMRSASARASCTKTFFCHCHAATSLTELSVGNSSYKVFHGPATWTDAQAACQEQGMGLAVAPSASIAAELHAAVGALLPSSDFYWLGGRVSTVTHDMWVWSDGSGPINWHGWSMDKPTSNYGDLCLSVEVGATERPGQEGRWSDSPCETRGAFICGPQAAGGKGAHSLSLGGVAWASIAIVPAQFFFRCR